MSVDVNYMEVECLKLLVDRIRRVYFVDRSVDLEVVVVHDHYQVVQLLKACQHGCLPNLSFLNLTVSQKGVHTVIVTGKLCRNCHTYCCGDSLSERPA